MKPIDPRQCTRDDGCGGNPCECNPCQHFFKLRNGYRDTCDICGAPRSRHDEEELAFQVKEYEEEIA